MRRDFIVSVTVNDRFPQTLDMMGPDPITVEQRVRRDLNRDPSVWSFSIDLVREVVLGWSSETGSYSMPLVVVPESFRWALPVVVDNRDLIARALRASESTSPNQPWDEGKTLWD